MGEFIKIVETLLNLTKLEHSLETEKAILKFVSICKTHQSIPNIDKETIEQFKLSTSKGLYEMEKSWASRIISSSTPFDDIKEYPFYTIYKRQVILDMEALSSSGHVLLPSSKIKVLVIGSGCLNQTAMFYQEIIGAIPDSIDISEEASILNQQVRKSLQIHGTHYVGDGATIQLPNTSGPYDIIAIVTLAGDNQIKKQEIIDNILPKLNEGGIIVLGCCGSSPGAGLILSRIDTTLLQGVRALSQPHPTSEAEKFNSRIICCKIK